MFDCPEPDCTKTSRTRKGLASHRKIHKGQKVRCPDCRRMIKDMEKHRASEHPEQHEPHIELDLRGLHSLPERVQELEELLAAAEAKIASQARTAERKNSRIRSLEKQVERLQSKQ